MSCTIPLQLAPGETVVFESAIRCGEDRPATEHTTHQHAVTQFTQRTHERQSIRTTVVTANERFNQWINRSLADLQMLICDTDSGEFPYAGVPWFSTPFGRDALVTALETCWLQPQLSRDTLRFLAHTQATQFDVAAAAEPGKIIHEMRDGEMAELGEIPFRRYYGTVDATPLFCGFPRMLGHGPTLYPVACSPQAWAAGAVFLILESLLGLSFSPTKPQIRFDNPQLPHFLDWVAIRNLRLAGGSMDLVLRRHPRDVGLTVERKEGDIDIVVMA